MSVIDEKAIGREVQPQTIRVNHFIRGKLVSGDAVRHTSRDLGIDFTTPAIDLDALITPRSEMPPLFDMKLSQIVDFLVEVGERLDPDHNPYLQESLEFVAATNPLPRRIIENLFRRARHFLTRDVLMASLNANFHDLRYFDEWVERTDAQGQSGAIRAFPPRMIHMLAGNSPAGCISSIAQGAMLKATNVFKMPSSDPFSCVAVLRTMADIDPEHPVVKSMSAVYWRGGDERIERTIYRPQYFSRIVAWGGGSAIDNVIRYLEPRLAARLLRSEDLDLHDRSRRRSGRTRRSRRWPKPPRRMSAPSIRKRASRAASSSSKASARGVEKFCAKLQERLGVDRSMASAVARLPPAELREEVEMLADHG